MNNIMIRSRDAELQEILETLKTYENNRVKLLTSNNRLLLEIAKLSVQLLQSKLNKKG